MSTVPRLPAAGAAAAPTYKAVKNAIVEAGTGKQVAVVLATNCTKRHASELASVCAQHMNATVHGAATRAARAGQ